MPMTYTEARALPTRDLVQHLLDSPESGHVVKAVTRERLIAFHETHVYDMCVKDSRNGGASHHEERTTNREERTGCDAAGWPDVIGDRDRNRNVEASDASADEFPWRDEELVLTWMKEKQVWQFAKEVEASGYRGEYMRNPEEAMEWVKTAIFSKTEWRDLHPEGVRFWKALRSKWSRWMATR